MESLQETSIQLLSIVLGGILTIISAYVGLFVAKVTQKAKIEVAKLEDEKAQTMFNNALDNAEKIIQTNVVAMENTLKQEILENILPDGKISKEELKELAVVVKKNVLNQMADDTLKVLNQGLGDVNQYIEANIEEILANLKAENKI